MARSLLQWFASPIKIKPRPTRSVVVVEILERRDCPATFHPDYLLSHGAGDSQPLATAGPTGLTPTQVRHAYGFDQLSLDGTGTTIAIVDAYDDPNIANDLHQFDLKFGLPDPVFTKVNQNGGTAMPTADKGWASEIALDVEWAHAIAPKANILLVVANSASDADLFTAVRYAARQPGVVAVSMSFGGSEFSGQTSYDSTFLTPSGHAGVTFLASSGDTGAPASYPSSSPNVVSVGGTTMRVDSSGNITSETGWSGSGGGLSAFESQPAYQKGIVTQSTTRRGTPDVAYDSDPNTGFPVYDSYNNGTSAPWSQFGGTSDAAPQWAGLVALADQGRAAAGLGSLDGATQTLPKLYSLPAADFHDIVSGSSTGSTTLSASAGYDLVTGRGSPYANRVIVDLIGTTTTPPVTPTVSRFAVSAPTSATAGSSFTITVSALDASGNLVAGYVGTVAFSSSDVAAILPANYVFTAADAGQHTFTVTLKTAGNQSVVVKDAATASLTGSATVAVSAVPTTTGGVLEDFETSHTWNYTGRSGISAVRATYAAHDGSVGLDDYNGNDWIYRTDTAARVKAGDTISVWLEFAGAADGRAYFGFGTSSTGTLSLVAAANTGQLILQNNQGFGYADLAAVSQTYQANHWYRLEVNWSTTGAIVGKLYDSNGTTLLQSVSARTTAITAGGFGFRATGSDKYWDTVTLTPGVNSFAAAASSATTASTTTESWQALYAALQWSDAGATAPAAFDPSWYFALTAKQRGDLWQWYFGS